MNSPKSDPSIDDMVSLHIPVRSRANPKGEMVAFTVRTTNWKENQYENILYLYHVSGELSQFTRDSDIIDFDWLGDTSLLVLREEGEEKPQLWVFETCAGEPLQLTNHETGVESFKPTKNGVLFIADDPERSKRKELKEKYGNVIHFEQEQSASALYYTSPTIVSEYQEKVKKLTEEEVEKTPKPLIEVSKLIPQVKIIDCFPSRGKVFLNCRPKDPLVYSSQAFSYVIEVELDNALTEHVNGTQWTGTPVRIGLPEQASIAAVNPDGSSLLIAYKQRDRRSYTQADLWHLKLGDRLDEPQISRMIKLTGRLDRNIGEVKWIPQGIIVSYADGTRTRYAELTLDGATIEIDLEDVHGDLSFDVSEGGFLSFIGANSKTLPEVYFTSQPFTEKPSLIRATNYSSQIKNWKMGIVETIEWHSIDGTMIQGILRKPDDYDPSKRYPLLFDVHGGPSSFNREILLEPYDYQRYPVVQLNNLDVLIIKPNYRGSIGKGQAFRELNVNNLGVGDLWDIESAIDHLDEHDIIDKENVGCMGWSQGGYISAFAGLRTNRFKAVSVGAGISDWYTYHISNDIPYFTDDYLSANPWQNPEIYKKTAPISGVDTAQTPTLIQHGAKDMRVPLSNGMEIYRALKAKGIPVEMFLYPDMAHPITKPRECRAVMQQNLDWFKHYLVNPEWSPVPIYWDST